jgi:hypothetical protein
MAYNDDEEHVSAVPQKCPGQPILEFFERLRPSDRNLRVAAHASQRAAALRAKLRPLLQSAPRRLNGERAFNNEAVDNGTGSSRAAVDGIERGFDGVCECLWRG